MSLESRRAVMARQLSSRSFFCSDELLRKRGYKEPGSGVGDTVAEVEQPAADIFKPCVSLGAA